MAINRRDFLKFSAGTGLMLAAGATPGQAAPKGQLPAHGVGIPFHLDDVARGVAEHEGERESRASVDFEIDRAGMAGEFAKRGVKIIGATAHFVTADLDEGPIIEQDVRRVSHRTTADEMVAIGRETEASVLSRAVRCYAEHRIFQNGTKTVIL